MTTLSLKPASAYGRNGNYLVYSANIEPSIEKEEAIFIGFFGKQDSCNASVHLERADAVKLAYAILAAVQPVVEYTIPAVVRPVVEVEVEAEEDENDDDGYDVLLQVEEDEAELDCGCVLSRGPWYDGSISFTFCPSHAAVES